ncbi:MAG: HipA domain-containing protein, partial [Lachnospiraceae bacterium]|nr:HipA domain-containing protein [Lachnospiraceae bacterium]
GSSYMEIASIIKTNSATPGKDLQELWRRIVFNMAVSNTDDHLRNHGFVLVKDGWSLSPVYDVNPNIYGDTLSLNVDSDNNLIDFNVALSVAKMYGLTDAQALEKLKEIKNVVESNWRRLAQQYGLSRSEIEGMAPAFDMRYKE